MSRSNMILRLYLLCIITVLLFGLTGMVTAHIVATFASNVDSLFLPLIFGVFVVGFFLLFHYALILGIISYSAQLRLAHASRQQGYNALPECEQQPAMTDALHDGDTLLLQRNITLSRSLWQRGIGVLVVVLTFFTFLALTEVCSIMVSVPLSAWFGTRLGLSSAVAPTLAPLDWLVLVYPVIIFGVTFAVPAWNNRKARRWQLCADDAGITLQTGWQRRFITWNMLQAIVQSKAKFTPDLTADTYHLVGKDGSFYPFTIDKPLLAGATTSRFTYVGGYEQYSADVVRLLATIRARSMLELRYHTTAIRMKMRLQKHLPITAIDADTILASTVADASWQPVVISAPPTIDQIKVTPRLSRWKIFWQGLIWETILILGFGLLIIFMGSGAQFGEFITHIRSQPIIVIPRLPTNAFILSLLGAFSLLLSYFGLHLAFGFAIAYDFQRQRLPQLRVTQDGISKPTKQDSSQPNVIPWKDIQAWLVMPANATRDFDTYVIVYGANKKIYWRVNRDMELAGRRVTGDRKIAFQEKLGEAHSIIAARTGLALRLIESNDAPV